eukprot:CAMPEP_0175040352 /NCGR_PEP_ID=MMETSP0052_2-20121109/1209_1 /TAXON_ID=51329 ORGANISM="Polytomella parva, Strain SAG 63-3" /NCGR_SAMPLE_ID=MMETSP0052_2 /ASSEMBLY_ACC=CAM_ASM_000194 /LENGTH=416 /DNA_ID=CAMNT_0016302541 /DNA_START=184 /DNA_END=1434 /DNA_ORIENTATION=+
MTNVSPSIDNSKYLNKDDYDNNNNHNGTSGPANDIANSLLSKGTIKSPSIALLSSYPVTRSLASKISTIPFMNPPVANDNGSSSSATNGNVTSPSLLPSGTNKTSSISLGNNSSSKTNSNSNNSSIMSNTPSISPTPYYVSTGSIANKQHQSSQQLHPQRTSTLSPLPVVVATAATDNSGSLTELDLSEQNKAAVLSHYTSAMEALKKRLFSSPVPVDEEGGLSDGNEEGRGRGGGHRESPIKAMTNLSISNNNNNNSSHVKSLLTYGDNALMGFNNTTTTSHNSHNNIPKDHRKGTSDQTNSGVSNSKSTPNSFEARLKALDPMQSGHVDRIQFHNLLADVIQEPNVVGLVLMAADDASRIVERGDGGDKANTRNASPYGVREDGKTRRNTINYQAFIEMVKKKELPLLGCQFGK